MSALRRLLAPALIAAALVGAAIAWIGFAFMRGDQPASQQPSPISPIELASPATVRGTVVPAPVPAPTTPVAPGLDAAPLRPPPLELATGLLPWERQIAEALSRGRDAKGRAREIFALLPRLPEEALATAAEQAVERLPDADYAATALPVLTDPQTHGQVTSVLFADVMERPDAITLPALLTIAQDPAHPFASPALDNLRLLLRADFGRDWSKWNEAIAAALTLK